MSQEQIKEELRKTGGYANYLRYLTKNTNFYALIETAFIVSASKLQKEKVVTRTAFLSEAGVNHRSFRDYSDLMEGCKVIRINLGKGNQHQSSIATIYCLPVKVWNQNLRLAFHDVINNDDWKDFIEELQYELE